MKKEAAVSRARKEEYEMSVSFRGVFTIPSTPFDEQLEVDWEGLLRTGQVIQNGATEVVLLPLDT